MSEEEGYNTNHDTETHAQCQCHIIIHSVTSSYSVTSQDYNTNHDTETQRSEEDDTCLRRRIHVI
jgi:hypothetical protein